MKTNQPRKTKMVFSGNANNCSDPHYSSRLFALRWLILPYFMLVIIHLICSINMQQPLLFADEMGYLGNAKYLSGNDHIRMIGGYYHPGYSMLILPAFIFSEPISIYKAVLVINGILMGSLFLPLFFSEKTHLYALLFGFFAGFIYTIHPRKAFNYV